MTTLFLAFANSADAPLPTLQQEDAALSSLLTPGATAGHYQIHREQYATVDKLAEYILKFKDTLALFLFSGHADRDRLFTTAGEAHGTGLARMLGQCPNLRLVMLNGCSTEGQVAELLAQGVKVVIATSAPINDRKATVFSTRFFDALQQKRSILAAFDMARGAVDMEFPGISFSPHRGAGFDLQKKEDAAWGIYYQDKNEHVTTWKLPAQSPTQVIENVDFMPNKELLDTLFEALGDFNDDIKKLRKQSQSGMEVTLPKKRMAVLNALPAPLAEPIRKLLVQMESETQGYDKVSVARLRQISQAYTTCMELMAFTMLAQLWEAIYDKGQANMVIAPELRESLKVFFRLSRAERQVYDFLDLVKKIKRALDKNQITYFVEELAELSSLFEQDARFAESLNTLNGLRLQLRDGSLDPAALAYHCKRGEASLSYLYGKLGFMARYRLATIKGIEVQKYRHRREPGYDHSTVVLHDLLGGFEVSHLRINRPLDNRSVLLLNEETWQYLNLSPFVLDENAFFDKTDVGKIYFYENYEKAGDAWCFRHVKAPDDDALRVSEEKYPLVKEQFDAFAQLIFQQTMQSL